MKKLFILALAVVIIVGCAPKRQEDGSISIQEEETGLYERNPCVRTIDSCEYLLWFDRMAHKGNCKFCEQRRKAELLEIVELLKDK